MPPDLLHTPHLTIAPVAPLGIFLSQIDLENDIAAELPGLLAGFNGYTALPDAITYLQGKKAIRMQQFIEHCGGSLRAPPDGHLLQPLIYCMTAAAQV